MIETYRFGPFELDPRTAELRRDGVPVPLQLQPVRILVALVERAGELVPREEIRARVWPDRVVDYEHGLNYAIRQIRAALGDDADAPAYVETLPRRGYRFVAAVERRLVREPVITPRRRLLASTLAGLVLTAGVVGALSRLDLDAAQDRPTVAVLPFHTLGSNSAHRLLADALTEQIIAELARTHPARLGVIARSSSSRFGESDGSIARADDELGADYVLEGALQGARGTAVRITAKLTRVSGQSPLWTRTYERSTADVLAIRGDVARQVAAAIAPGALDSRQAPVSPVLPEDTTAREAYLIGRGLLPSRDPGQLEEARRGFERVLALEPDHAGALVGLGEALLRMGRGQEARRPLERALRLEPNDPQAHHLLAQVLLFNSWEWGPAERHLARAIELRPGHAAAYQVRAYWLAMTGRMEEALASMTTALRLDPLSSYVHADAGWIYYWAGRLDPAETRCERTLELDPESGSARICLLFVRMAQGDGRAAREAARGLMVAHGASAAELGSLDSASANAGLERYWAWEARRLEAVPERSGSDAFLLALAYGELGRRDEAFRELDAAHRGRSPWMLWLQVEPRLEPLRGDARWSGLVRRMGYSDGGR